MSAEAWVALGVGFGVPLTGAIVWLIFQVRRLKQILDGNGQRGLIKQVEHLRDVSHWQVNGMTVLCLTLNVELPGPPQP